jgi:hypothetical protein
MSSNHLNHLHARADLSTCTTALTPFFFSTSCSRWLIPPSDDSVMAFFGLLFLILIPSIWSAKLDLRRLEGPKITEGDEETAEKGNGN